VEGGKRREAVWWVVTVGAVWRVVTVERLCGGWLPLYPQERWTAYQSSDAVFARLFSPRPVEEEAVCI
jgi:hypothetical protein